MCAGESQAEVARAKNLGESTIRAVVRRVNTRRTTANAPQSGRPRITNDRDRRRIIQLVRQNPLWTYSKLQYESGLQISRSTFQRVLKENGIQNWIAKARPALTMGHAIDRLAFAQQNLNKDWSNTIISDECSVKLGVGKRRQWAFGYPHQKWDTDKITTYNKSKGPSIMVWACISPSFGKSDLIIMTRDESAARNGYTSWSYVETLEAGLKPLYSGEEFQQDGASIHTSKAVRQTLQHWGINLLQGWPAYSPDLSPIEHMWPRLKENLYTVCPALNSEPSQARQIDLMIRYLPIAWDLIPRHVVDGCLNSMKDRLQAVIDAQGWQTRF